jgi:hypothetical protein
MSFAVRSRRDCQRLADSLKCWEIMALHGVPAPRWFHAEFGGASVLVNGAVFKTVGEAARAVLGRFDSYTPPPKSSRQNTVVSRQ